MEPDAEHPWPWRARRPPMLRLRRSTGTPMMTRGRSAPAVHWPPPPSSTPSVARRMQQCAMGRGRRGIGRGAPRLDRARGDAEEHAGPRRPGSQVRDLHQDHDAERHRRHRADSSPQLRRRPSARDLPTMYPSGSMPGKPIRMVSPCSVWRQTRSRRTPPTISTRQTAGPRWTAPRTSRPGATPTIAWCSESPFSPGWARWPKGQPVPTTSTSPRWDRTS